MPPRANMGEVVRLIEDAINSPSSESEGQVVEAKVIEDMSVDNQVIEAIDESFKPTLQVLEDGSGSKRERSTLMAGVVGYRGAL